MELTGNSAIIPVINSLFFFFLHSVKLSSWNFTINIYIFCLFFFYHQYLLIQVSHICPWFAASLPHYFSLVKKSPSFRTFGQRSEQKPIRQALSFFMKGCYEQSFDELKAIFIKMVLEARALVMSLYFT